VALESDRRSFLGILGNRHSLERDDADGNFLQLLADGHDEDFNLYFWIFGHGHHDATDIGQNA
jgi:hypothetical protein